VRRGEKETRVNFWNFITVDDEKKDGEKQTRCIPVLCHFTVLNFNQIALSE